MNDDISGHKQRRPRHKIKKPVRASGNGIERDGHVRDISGTGAALEIESAWGDDDLLDLDIDDIGEMSGRVARSFEEAVQMVERSEIRDSMTVIAVLHAARLQALGKW